VLERTNAMHVQLPEQVEWITIDVAWTRQKNILPSARKLLTPTGRVISLIKPHYEAKAALLKKGILPSEEIQHVLQQVQRDIEHAGFEMLQTVQSPIKGAKGNTEMLGLLRPR
jgi:23S rRNA (cytidine1920-2'-O)/16S rRNA (cytidine1409-2'-O)-methyltransferase